MTSSFAVAFHVRTSQDQVKEEPIWIEFKTPNSRIATPKDDTDKTVVEKCVHSGDFASGRTRGALRSPALRALVQQRQRMPLQTEQNIPIETEWITVRHGRRHLRSHRRVSVFAKVSGHISVLCTAWYSPLAKQVYLELEGSLSADVHLKLERNAVPHGEARTGGHPTLDAFSVKLGELLKAEYSHLQINFDIDSAHTRPRDSLLGLDPDSCQVAMFLTILCTCFSGMAVWYDVMVPNFPILLFCAGVLCALAALDRPLSNVSKSK